MLSKNNLEKSNSSNNVCMPDEIINRFVKISTRLELNAGEPFISQDEFDESIFFIESGEVEVEKSGKIISIIKAGDVVGEMAFIDRRPRIASVRARTACVLLKVERADLLRELGHEPDLLMEFVHAIEKRRNARIEPRTDEDSQLEIESFLGAVTKEGISHRAVHHPYLLALRDGKLPDMKWALADFARQYHGYSSHFPRYLTTVIGRLERSEHRIALMENLTEESGIYEEEELDELAAIGVEREWITGIPHPLLFHRFCVAAGVNELGPDADTVEVICWREMFLSVLSNGSAAEALGALGLGTENVVSTMYNYFLPALKVLGVPASETVFFPLHAAVDDHHQESLLDISRYYAGTPQGRIDLLKGMRKALALRAGFWDWLHMRSLTMGKCDENATMTLSF